MRNDAIIFAFTDCFSEIIVKVSRKIIHLCFFFNFNQTKPNLILQNREIWLLNLLDWPPLFVSNDRVKSLSIYRRREIRRGSVANNSTLNHRWMERGAKNGGGWRRWKGVSTSSFRRKDTGRLKIERPLLLTMSSIHRSNFRVESGFLPSRISKSHLLLPRYYCTSVVFPPFNKFQFIITRFSFYKWKYSSESEDIRNCKRMIVNWLKTNKG